MSLFLFKSVLASVFLVAGIIALLCMLTLMGRTGLKISATFLRILHRTSGFIFFVLLIVISYFCIKYWIHAGDNLSTRAVLHGVLAFVLFAVILMKILIVQFYKQLIRFAPAMGMIVFCTAFVVFSTSAGYYFLRTLCVKSTRAEVSSPPAPDTQGSIKRGTDLFRSLCSPCHFADKEEEKLGPGLKYLLKNDELPHSGRPATIENVKKQLLRPILTMPSFARLTEQELADLLAYLETL